MTNLRIPGPTPVPDDVLAAVARPMIDHRGRVFADLIERVSARLQEFFQTRQEVLILTASGTGAMEAAIVNTLSPGDSVLAVTVGSFGDRFAEIAEAYGARVGRLAFEWGEAAQADELRQTLVRSPEVKAVLLTHNETSTGITNPLAELAAVVREFDKLLLVDSISALGSIPMQADAWGLDVVVAGSQKGWMVPPGLAFISMSDRAWKANVTATMPRFYFDLQEALAYRARGQTPWTPAVSIFFGLDVALQRLSEEGLEAVYARHERVGNLTRKGIKALGLDLLARDESYASNTVTAVKCPPGVDVNALRNLLEDEFDVVLAAGQGKLARDIFRIGHLGLVDERDIRGVLEALETALPRVGYTLPAYP